MGRRGNVYKTAASLPKQRRDKMKKKYRCLKCATVFEAENNISGNPLCEKCLKKAQSGKHRVRNRLIVAGLFFFFTALIYWFMKVKS